MLTKGAIGNLVNRYRAVLKKCNLINVFGSLAVASMLVMGGAGVAEAAEYPVANPETISGGEYTSTTTYAGHGGFTTVESGSSLNISDATFKNFKISNSGGAHGGVIFNRGTLNVTDTRFEQNYGNTNYSMGGAIFSKGTATIVSSKFINNKSSFGAAIYNQEGTLTVKESLFQGNIIHHTNNAWSFASTIDTNDGCAGVINIENSRFIENGHNGYAGNGGAGTIYFGTTSTERSWIKNSIFEKNYALYSKFGEDENAAHAGAIGQYNGDLLIEKCTFIENKADYGGAIAVYQDGKQEIKDSTFTGNSAKAQGGAIHNTGDLTLAGTNTFSGNIANGTPNDIYNEGNLTINGDVIFDGGIVNAGTISGEGALVVNSLEASVTNESGATSEVNVEVSGDLNDSMSDAERKELAADLKEAHGDNFTGIREGLVQGAVDASGNQKVSTTMQTSLELATSAPLAVNRILMNDIRKRMGDLRTNPSEYGAWARYEGGKLKGDGGLTNDFNTIQVGADKAIGDSFRLGAAFSYTYSDVEHATGDAEADTFMFSGYGIWMGQNGMFADVIARVGNTDTDMTVKGLETSIDSMTYSLSGEFGWRFDLCKSFYVEPQVELTYTYVDGDKFSLGFAKFDVDEMNSLIGRAGVLAGWKFSDRGDVYARASVLQEFAGDTEITGKNGSGSTYKQDGDDTWFEYGIGANVKLTDSTYIWADVERTEGAEIDEEWRGTVGVRFSF